MHIKIASTLPEFHALQDDWNSLLKSYKPQPLPLRHEWINEWWKCFNKGKQMYLFCVYIEDKLVAIAPFTKQQLPYRFFSANVLRLMVNGKSPYSDIIFHSQLPDYNKLAAIELIINSNTEDIMMFSKIPETSYVYHYLRNTKHDHRYGVKSNITTPILKISGTWDEYFKTRSRKFHKSMNNKLNKYNKQNDMTIRHELVTHQDQPIVNDIIEISKNSWKRKVNNDLHSNSEGRNFLFGLIDNFGKNNHVHAWIMKHNEKPIAYEFHIIFDKVSYPIRADFDESYKKLSPGSILEYTILKQFFAEQSVELYDSCADDYWYLHNWSNEVRHQYDIEIFPDGIKPVLMYILEHKLIKIFRVSRDIFHHFFGRGLWIYMKRRSWKTSRL